jgi:hypothetical protein
MKLQKLYDVLSMVGSVHVKHSCRLMNTGV